jgi:hypothetical protein
MPVWGDDDVIMLTDGGQLLATLWSNATVHATSYNNRRLGIKNRLASVR